MMDNQIFESFRFPKKPHILTKTLISGGCRVRSQIFARFGFILQLDPETLECPRIDSEHLLSVVRVYYFVCSIYL